MAIKCSATITLARVNDGTDGTIKSDTAPTDITMMWLDTSVEPNILKYYDGTEWVMANDQTSDIDNKVVEVINQTASSIEATKTDILLEVSEKHYSKEDTDILVGEVSTSLEQTKDSFEMQFTNITDDLNNLASETNDKFEETKKYIRFEDGKILLGAVGNQLELQITNDRISFLQAGNEVAYFSNSKLYVTDGEYLNSLKIGKFAFVPRANGSLDFKKVGD